MDSSTRQLFARQLAHWAEAALLNGRSPFRKVETAPLTLTTQGAEFPPLVLWVNRESCMAGGLIFFPGADPQPDLAAGDRCAQALGLGHFVTWGAREILFWETKGQQPRQLRRFALPADAAASPGAQHDLLLRVLDELKLLAVLGTVPPEQLDPAYLANLCFGTLEAAIAPLSQAFRLARGEQMATRTSASPEDLAWGKAVLVLTRLLALLLHDRLPLSLQPEGMERAMHFALDSLPADLAACLGQPEEEIPLPLDATVRFHHLFRRLNQLRPACTPIQIGQALALLARQLATNLGAFSLPFDSPQSTQELLLIHAQTLPDEPALAFCATPPWQALQVLRRHLQRLPPIRWTLTDLFALPGSCLPRQIAGTLTNQGQASPLRRQAMTTHLRNSWPNRRFALNASCPVWLWECLHLLGICAPGGSLELRLPLDWLCADYGLVLHELLCEQFTLERLEEEEATLSLRVRNELDPTQPVQLHGPGGARTLRWEELRQQHRGYLRLALMLPDPLWLLLQQGFLRCARTVAEQPEQREALYRYSRSTLGRQLWAALSRGLPLPSAANLATALPRFGLPIPGAEALAALLRLTAAESAPSPSQADLDRELALWLGPELQFAASPPPARRRSAPANSVQTRELLAEQILAAACGDGIPRFPEQYLYDHYRPALQHFRYAPPLQSQGEFFGRYTLQDAAGQSLEIEGSETLRALLLSSSLGASPVDLPLDRELTKTIVDRYCQDLIHLRQNLTRQAHLLAKDPTLADQLVEQLWKSLRVPDWNLVNA